MTLYPYLELPITSKVQECCGWEFAAKLGEFSYSDWIFMKILPEMNSGTKKSPFNFESQPESSDLCQGLTIPYQTS